MLKNPRTLAMLVAVGSLLMLPATSQADHKGTPHGKGKGKGETKRCAKTPKVGFSVAGTLVTFTADNPATQANEASVTLEVTKANSHTRKSGELADQDAQKKGVQVEGATYTVTAANDGFTLKLNGYEGTDTPSAGDKVKVTGKVAVTKKKCAPTGTSTADRYATPDIRKVTVSDRDPDQP